MAITKNKLCSFVAVAMVVVIVVSQIGAFTVQAQADDITGTFFEIEFREAITRGWVQGFPNGTFQPDANITRAQFITLLDNVFQLPSVNRDVRFSDVSANDWFYGTLLKFQPYVNPHENNSFQGITPITREEVSFIIFNLINIEIEPWGSYFSDRHEISSWAYQQVNALRSLGILMGNPDNTFSPRRNITRAEAVLIVYRLNDLIATQGTTLIAGTDHPRQFSLEDLETMSGQYFQIADRGVGRPPSFVGGTITGVNVQTFDDALHALHAVRDVFGIYNAFEELVPIYDRGGRRNYHFQQVHNGVPVLLATFNVTTDINGNIISVASGFRPEIRYAFTTVEPTISYDEAIQAALDARGMMHRLFYYNPEWVESWGGINASVNILAYDGLSPQLIWELTIARMIYYIDAHSGEYIHSRSTVTPFGIVPATGVGSMGDVRNFDVASIYPAGYSMDDFNRNVRTHVRTIDFTQEGWEHSPYLLGTLATSPYADNWESSPAAVDAHYSASQFFEFFRDAINRPEEAQALRFMRMYSSVDANIENAFWVEGTGASGMCGFALFGRVECSVCQISSIGFATTTNDDDDDEEEDNCYCISYAAALDVIGHEFTHGVFTHRRGFGRRGVTAQLHEAYSDIFGKLFEMYMLDGVESWSMGNRIGLQERDLSNPARFGNPIRFGEYPYRVPRPHSDAYGHHNSTVLSHVFYRIHTDNRIPSISSVNTSAQLWYDAIALLLLDSDFLDARGAVMNTAMRMGIPFDEVMRMHNIFDESLIILDWYIQDRGMTRDVHTWATWYHEPLVGVLNLGIMRGGTLVVYEDGRAVNRPRQVNSQGDVSIGEFIRMTHNTLYHNAPNFAQEEGFDATQYHTAWTGYWTNYMVYAYRNGWIHEPLYPTSPIRRQQAAHVIWTAFEGMDERYRRFYTPEILCDNRENWNRLADISDIHPNYINAVFQLNENQIIRGNPRGENYYFLPLNYLRRAEAAIILMNMFAMDRLTDDNYVSDESS
ncbi:MAG: S-layer homology domain-containing protein [Defluviitaleaceae bacterium]|nr:S-layer homology domain-containing protein [Defluviitaleaceae bacterium]